MDILHVSFDYFVSSVLNESHFSQKTRNILYLNQLNTDSQDISVTALNITSLRENVKEVFI